jgi:hypothetical protein
MPGISKPMSEPASGVSRFGCGVKAPVVMTAAAIHDVGEILAALDQGLGRSGRSDGQRRQAGGRQEVLVHDVVSPKKHEALKVGL